VSEPEEYWLDIRLAIHGAQDADAIRGLFLDGWHAKKTNVRGRESLGVRFSCPASRVVGLFDTLGHLLDSDVDSLTLQTTKVR
jgi:hypothetical protein